MRILIPVILLATLILPGELAAQGRELPRPEIGFRGGLSVYREQGENFSLLSFPGSSIFGVATAHAMLFVGPTLALEPQFGFVRTGSGSNSSGSIAANLQLDQFFADPLAGAPFGFLTGGLISGFSDSGSGDSVFAFGGGAGYRTIVRETLGVRFEARYRRFFGDGGAGSNEFSLLVGLAAIIGDGQ